MPLSQTKAIPAKACQFAAVMQVGAKVGDSKTVPIKMVARSGKPVANWFWGKVVHDLGGMTVCKQSIPLDYCHDDDKVIGFADKFDTTSGDLEATGELVPYSVDPDDKATEIIYKSENGVPYEASIFFDGPLAIEEVGEGASALVNGQQLNGPLTIIRQWTLRGIAICPYGNDPSTSAATKFARGGDIQAQVISKENLQMSVTTGAAPAADKVADAGATAGGTKPAETAVPVAAVTETKPTDAPPAAAEVAKLAEVAPAAAAPAAAPVVAPAAATAMTDGAKFLKEFGDKGGVWFAQGKTFAEAQALHFADLKTHRDHLAAENQKLKGQLAAARGEENPVEFTADPSEVPGGALPLNKHLPVGIAKFAASMNLKK